MKRVSSHRFGPARTWAALLAITLASGAAAPLAGGGTMPSSAERLQSACTIAAAQGVAAALGAGVTVKLIANRNPTMSGATRFVKATGNVPAFCQITGSFVTNPVTGKTANFMATLPANWNGKYLQMGCSGHCGQFVVSDPALPSTAATYSGEPIDIVRRGYAAFATDQGHEGLAGGTWAIKPDGTVDEDKIEDFQYRATKVLATVGKRYTTAFYRALSGDARPIRFSYFNGCSGGGRDALVAASYFPEEFDGITAGSAYSGGSTAFQLSAVPLATVRSETAFVPPELLSRISPIVNAQCDALDGVKDNLIQNPAACNFRPERDLPRCGDAGAAAGQCFTPTQIETISVALTAVTDEQGNLVQPGFAVSDVQASTFITPTRSADFSAADPFPGADGATMMANNGYWPMGNAYLKVLAHRNDPAFFTRNMISFRSGGPGAITDFRAVVPASEAAFVRERMARGIGHFPQNLDRLISRRGKLLIWHNLSDHTLTPYMSINYYKQLAARHGGYARLQRNVRLFGLPGTLHCGLGGDGPNTFDALTAMENWVERGRAPDAIMAHVVPTTPPYGLKDFSKPSTRSMPLCKFPAMARYGGKGNVMDGANWTCPAGDARMLTLGESGRRAGVMP